MQNYFAFAKVDNYDPEVVVPSATANKITPAGLNVILTVQTVSGTYEKIIIVLQYLYQLCISFNLKKKLEEYNPA